MPIGPWYRRGVRGAFVGIAASVLACSGPVEVDLSPPWPNTAQVAIVVLDPDGRPVGDGPRPSRGGAISVEIQEPAGHELLAYVWEEALGPDGETPLIDCGLTYTPVADPLPEPVSQWRTGPIDSSNLATLTLQPSTRQLIPLYAEGCQDPPEDPCEGIDVDGYPIPPTAGTLTVLAMTSTMEAFAAGAVESSTIPPINLARIFDRRAEPLDSPRIFGAPDGLAWDGGDVFYGVAGPDARRDTQLFAFDRRGEARPVPALLLGEGRREVTAGGDGSIFVSGANGVYEVIKGSTVAVPILGLSPPIARVAAGSRQELYAVNGLREIWRYDGSAWFREWQPDVLSTARVVELAVRGEVAVGVGVIGTLLLRDPQTRTWVQMPQPENVRGYNFGQVAILAGGRIVASVDAGDLVIWNGRSWCQPPPVGLGTYPIADIAASPDGRQAFALTQPRPLIGAELKVIELSAP